MRKLAPLLLIAGVFLTFLVTGKVPAAISSIVSHHASHVPVISAGYADPIGKGLVPYRIDQGDDYNGAGDLYALGSGTVIKTQSTGWPGGAFILLHLNSGRYKGRYVYYAESITPDVSPGDDVTAGQKIGHAIGCSSCGIELGWASADPQDHSLAYVQGQASTGLASGDAGAYPTRDGVDFNSLVVSLGGPSCHTYGKPVQG